MTAGSMIKEDVTQEQILQAARVLFEKHGFQKVTMDDVARAIGKGRSSLYYYYKSKDEVFDAVLDLEVSDIIAEITRAMAHVAAAEQKIRAFCAAKMRMARKRKSFFTTMEEGMSPDEMSRYAQKKQAARRAFTEGESALLRGAIINGKKSGEFPKLATKEVGHGSIRIAVQPARPEAGDAAGR